MNEDLQKMQKIMENRKIIILGKDFYLQPFAIYNSTIEFNAKTLAKEGYHLFCNNKQLSLRNFGINIYTKGFNECGFCQLQVQPEDEKITLKCDCIINKEGEVVFEAESCINSLTLINNIAINNNKVYNLLTKEYLFSIQSQSLSSKRYLVCKKSLFDENVYVRKKEYQKYRDCLILLDTVTCEVKILE